MNIFMQILGWIAAVITVGMYLPQIIKTVKTKSVGTLSKPAFIMVYIGTIAWTLTSPLIPSWQNWSTNATIGILMLAVIYYLWKDNKIIFISIVLITIVAEVMGLTFLIIGVDVPFWTLLLFSIFAGIAISLWALPQAIKIVKTKKVGDFSLLSSFVITFGNTCWVTYWGLMASESSTNNGLIIATMASAFSSIGVITQLPILYVYFKYENKSRA